MTAPPQDPDAVSPPTILKKEFASRMGIARSRVTQLAQAGMPVEPDGKINEARARAWCEEREIGSKQKRSGNLAQVKLAFEREKLRKLRFDNALRDGSQVDREEIRRLVTAHRKADRDAHMAWVQRVSPAMAAELGVEAARMFAVLDAATRDLLHELALAPVGGVVDGGRGNAA